MGVWPRSAQSVQVPPQADRVLLFIDKDSNPLRPVEQLVDALKAHGGKEAATAVQRQLAAASAAEAMAVGAGR